MWKFLGGKPLWQSIKDEYYLFIGYSFVFFAVYLIIGFFFNKGLNASILIAIYIVLYVIVDLFRNYVATGSYDLSERMKDVKVLGK